MDYIIIKESLSKYKKYKNICLYHSVYIWLNEYMKIELELFMSFFENKDLFSSIEDFFINWNNLHIFLLKICKNKKILNNLFLGVFISVNNKAILKSYIDLSKIKSNEILNKNYDSIKMYDNIPKNKYPILVINKDEHFDPIILTSG